MRLHVEVIGHFSVAMAAGKRAALSLSKKVDIINLVEKGERSRSTIAEEFCIARSTVTLLYSKRKDIREAFDSSKFCSTRKRLRLAKYSDIEDAHSHVGA